MKNVLAVLICAVTKAAGSLTTLPVNLQTPAPVPCTHANKQVALYLEYNIEPSLRTSPATDISVDHLWNSTKDMRRYGKNGVYAAQPIGVGSFGGYFGSQADGNTASGGLLFSIWDSVRKKQDQCADPSKAPNATWCARRHSFPLSDNCRRHCLDCGLHPGWHNTTGTQCSVSVVINEGDRIRFRLFRSANGTSLHDPLGMGIDYMGSEWTLTATTASKEWTVGKMFFEDEYSGLTRFQAFHEHIGCTPCNAFYESEVRVGPYAIQPGNRVVQSINFERKNVSCELYDVKMLPGPVPSAQFFTGPGTGPHPFAVNTV